MKYLHQSPDTTLNHESSVIFTPQGRKSVFYGHEQKIHHSFPESKPVIHADWITVLFIVCSILLAWNHVYNPSRLLQVIKAPFSRRFINQLVREGNLFNERIAFTFMIMFFLVLALFLYILNEHYIRYQVYGLTGFYLYLTILAGITSFSTVKVALIYFTGVIFRTRETTYQYLLNQMIFAIILSPLLLLFSILIVYIGTGFFVTFSILLVLFIFLFQFIKGFFIGMALTKFSYLLLFVYLCSLEFLPLLVVTKIVLNIAKSAVV